MGCASSFPNDHSESSADVPTSFASLTAELTQHGLESVQLAVGFDFSASDPDSVKNGESELVEQQAIDAFGAIAKALENFRSCDRFQSGRSIPAYGFGDVQTNLHAVFSFNEGNRPCEDIEECVMRFKEISQEVIPCGKTSFVPVVREALDRIRKNPRFHVLLIITRNNELGSSAARDLNRILDEAAMYALTVIAVGIGPGAWERMRNIRKENFRFVQFAGAKKDKDYSDMSEASAVIFARRALETVPQHYEHVKKRGLLSDNWKKMPMKAAPAPMKPPYTSMGRASSTSSKRITPQTTMSTAAPDSLLSKSQSNSSLASIGSGKGRVVFRRSGTTLSTIESWSHPLSL